MRYIYLRTNIINGKQYVGQTTDLNRRERDWRKIETNYANNELNEDRVKYGIENFKLELLEICKNEDCDEKERFYIEKFGTLYPNGYNKYSGGLSGFSFKMAEITKEKISEATIGKTKTEETKKKISEGLKNHPSKSSKVYQYDLDNNLVAIWPSAREAARKLNYSQGNISICCNGGFYSKQRNKWVNRKQYNGYIWSLIPL